MWFNVYLQVALMLYCNSTGKMFTKLFPRSSRGCKHTHTVSKGGVTVLVKQRDSPLLLHDARCSAAGNDLVPF